MTTNSDLVLKEVFDVDPMTWLWAKINSSTILKLKLLEFIN
jgi:hypothetical protein